MLRVDSCLSVDLSPTAPTLASPARYGYGRERRQQLHPHVHPQPSCPLAHLRGLFTEDALGIEGRNVIILMERGRMVRAPRVGCEGAFLETNFMFD